MLDIHLNNHGPYFNKHGHMCARLQLQASSIIISDIQWNDVNHRLVQAATKTANLFSIIIHISIPYEESIPKDVKLFEILGGIVTRWGITIENQLGCTYFQDNIVAQWEQVSNDPTLLTTSFQQLQKIERPWYLCGIVNQDYQNRFDKATARILTAMANYYDTTAKTERLNQFNINRNTFFNDPFQEHPPPYISECINTLKNAITRRALAENDSCFLIGTFPNKTISEFVMKTALEHQKKQTPPISLKITSNLSPSGKLVLAKALKYTPDENIPPGEETESPNEGLALERVQEEPQGLALERVQEEPQGLVLERVQEEQQGLALERVQEEPQGLALERVQEEPQGLALERVQEEQQGRTLERADAPALIIIDLSKKDLTLLLKEMPYRISPKYTLTVIVNKEEHSIDNNSWPTINDQLEKNHSINAIFPPLNSQ